jgi:hypothetical protein
VFAADGSFTHAFGFDVVPGGGPEFEICSAATGCKEGVLGGGAGQLSRPTGVTVDGTGNLYISDRFNNRISVFSKDGSFIHAFGFDVVPGGGTGFEVCSAATGCKEGTIGGGAGQLSYPTGIALDGAGNLYVTEELNHRISVFGASGSFLRAFGFDVILGGGPGFEVCVAGMICKKGALGGQAGQLYSPQGLAIDRAGTLYVPDQGNHRINVFGAAGSFTHAFGFDVDPGWTGFEICSVATSCQAGVPGRAVGQLSSPAGVATDCRGAVWVVEIGNDRLQRFGEPGMAPPPCLATGRGISPPPPPIADTLAPAVSDFSLSRKRFRAGSRATPVNALAAALGSSAPRGSAFRFTLSERADVRVVIERALPGQTAGKRCRVPSRAVRRRRPCTRFKRAGTITRTGRAAGRSTIPFSGRIGRRALKHGRYRATMSATDPTGNRSKTRRASFRIVRR